MRIKIVLASGLTLTAIAVFVALLHSPSTVVAANGVPATGAVADTDSNVGICQAEEKLPAGTSAIRLAIDATTGPPVSIEVFDGSHIVTRGTTGAGWYGSAVTVPVRPIASSFLSDTKVCFQLSLLTGYISIDGAPTHRSVAARSNGKPLPGRIRISYLESSHQSWWSVAGAVIEHMGLGRAASGTWIVLPIVALAAAAIGLGSWVLIRELQ